MKKKIFRKQCNKASSDYIFGNQNLKKIEKILKISSHILWYLLLCCQILVVILIKILLQHYIDKNVMVVECIYSLPYTNNMLASTNKIKKRIVTLHEISQQTDTS